MELYGHKPSRRAGQNFLIHRATAERFVESAAIDPAQNSTVVEIGPGLGSITQVLCGRYQKVVALEKDTRLLKLWNDQLEKPKNLELIEADASNFDYAHLAKRLGGRLVIFGNLPFNVSTLIVQRLLQQWQHVAYAHLTFQKEVALRLMAEPGSRDYGSLTIHTKIYCDADKRLFIGKGQYFPVPKVDSVVVGLKFLQRPRLPEGDLKEFEAFTRQLFLFRRKTMLNGFRLAERFAGWAPTAKTFLQSHGIAEAVRVETLDLKTLHQIFIHCRQENA